MISFPPTTLDGMTQETWSRLTPAQRDKLRDNSGLTPQLVGLEGYRVAVNTDTAPPVHKRFIVGKSTGWRPVHLEVKTRRSMGGGPADKKYRTVHALEKVR